MSKLCYGVIGNGRMAKHFTHYLHLLKIPYKQWNRTEDKKKLIVLAETCSPILILINDDAIPSFIEQNAFLKEKQLVHFSAALNIKEAYSAHPLLSFSENVYSLDVYQKMPFICDENAPAFNLLLPQIHNPHFKIPSHLKTFYHALCVLSGNFTVILWQKFFSDLEEKLHIPKEQAYPYLQQLMINLLNNPQTALTGPLVRKDDKTIESHLMALKGDSFQGVYQAFLKAFEELKPKG